MFTRRFLPLSLFLALVLPAASEQLYVRNRPFKGAIVREGKVTWIELQSLASVLELKLVPAEGGGFQLSREAMEAAPVAARTSQSPAVKQQNQELAQKFGVRGYPTIIFATHSGQLLGQYGYDEGGPSVWTKKASTYLKKR